MKTIELTQGKVALVDDEDYEKVNKFRWRLKSDSCNNYAYAVNYKEIPGADSKFVSLHRFIMNFPKEMIVDHKDHDGLNCQKLNMRVCSVDSNMRNTTSPDLPFLLYVDL